LHCISNNTQGIIILLDAKKPFDSVDHIYLFKILARYGFCSKFINIIKMLYKDLESNVMFNGYTYDYFILEQCVKQGDASSSGLFILFVDPLILRINNSVNIKSITFTSPYTFNETNNKAQGFADDITITTMNDSNLINSLFEEYENFSNMSGIFLKTDKTEITSTICKISKVKIK